MLPQTLRPKELRAIIGDYRAQAASPGTVGALRDVWVEADEPSPPPSGARWTPTSARRPARGGY